MDNLFCIYFFMEITLRFLAYKCLCKMFVDGTFLFDTFLVSLMVWSTWIQPWLYHAGMYKPNTYFKGRGATVLRVFRLFRLSRLMRTARLMRFLPEIGILAKGIRAAMTSVVSTLCALSIVIYIAGLIFTQLLSGKDIASDRFDTVPMSCNFLFLQILCGIDAQLVMDLLNYGRLYYIMFLLFVLLGSLTIMNMLIGGVVDVVSTVAEVEREKMKTKELEQQIDKMVAMLDHDRTGSVDKEEFQGLLKDPGTLLDLKRLGVDLVAFIDFTRWIFPDEGLTVKDFRQIMLQFMGSHAATVQDVAEVREVLSIALALLEDRIMERFDTLATRPEVPRALPQSAELLK
jgi:hypothetical protein